MARGVATNTNETMAYLQACEAVTNIIEQPDRLLFTFDPTKQPIDGIPDGVFFDLTEAPF